ncbi:ABC transporter ATP-binding protein [Lysinibacillus sphaericus]|uniref:ABC transporter ATP-binding protein n=1 Tax=Lysinibacillus sphaericus TaxID=1421 RepID=UPI0004DFC6A6|nr:ABC transporter ATP-binding protein [Lysinibacillus sphaericus]MBG9690987.1 ABC transporter ATP-binding protein [Lysinibacillus sphaericus]MBG9755845.1 ABC transporter ATP-binding protein [Lysinibacillus sphaericus]MDM5350803.1 ABC transporter ATP-binding protein [Lysinibacillus sphaericus]MEB7452503.1 ABC transporter ATP-binding protein [Lysinibacillus sphaericus]QIC49008.1 ABC transporter ATP-binding protein [Lysinibacillus sphaericus]
MRLEINNITKKFKYKTAVNNFSLIIDTNECVGLIGPNGAGKSTLIQIIADILYADEGNIVLDGQKISKMKNQIGYLPQYPNFFSWMTAFETLSFMGTLSGISKKQLQKDIPILLEKVGLGKEAHVHVGTFSGGMKQRLGIAQALLHKPALIIMDEPVSALDPIGRREVLNLLKDIKKETTILLSTHILGDAEEVCERFVVIKNGYKIEDATKLELLNRYQDSAIFIMIQKKDVKWLKTIEQLPYVKKIEGCGDGFKVYVNQLEADAHRLLQYGLDSNVIFTKFNLGVQESLEEIFLELVV